MAIANAVNNGLSDEQYLQNIRDFVDATLSNNDMTMSERVAAINDAASQYGVSRSEIAQATGYDVGTVNNFLGETPYSKPAENVIATPTLTPDVAKDLMYRSMTTGVPTAEFDKYGGYNAVASMYNANGGGYSLNEIPAEKLKELATVVADTGVGNMTALKDSGVKLASDTADAMRKNGIDAATIEKIIQDVGVDTTVQHSGGYKYATQSGGIGADQYYKNIKDYVASVLGQTSLSDAEKASTINDAIKQYEVSVDDIIKATGYTADQVNKFLTPAAAGTTTTTSGTGVKTAANNYQSSAAYTTAGKKLSNNVGSYESRLRTAFAKDSAGDVTAGNDYSTIYGELSSKGLSDAEIAAVFSSAINQDVPLANVQSFGQKYTIGQLTGKLGNQDKTITGLNTQVSGLTSKISDLTDLIGKLQSTNQNNGNIANTSGQVNTTNSSTSTNNTTTDQAVAQKMGNYLYSGNYNGGTPAAGVSYLTNGSSTTTGSGDVQGWGLSGIGMSNYGKSRRAADGSQRDVYFTPKKYNKSGNLQGAGWGASYMPF